MRQQRRDYAKARAFTLVEVLVALLIVGGAVFGWLMLALQTSQQVEETAYRAQAQVIAQDLIERINSNPAAWPQAFTAASHSAPSTAFSSSCSQTKPCTDPNVMATQDVRELASLAVQQLPAGKVGVHEHCATASSLPCVVVAWQSTEANPENCMPTASNADTEERRCVLVHFWSGGQQ